MGFVGVWEDQSPSEGQEDLAESWMAPRDLAVCPNNVCQQIEPFCLWTCFSIPNHIPISQNVVVHWLLANALLSWSAFPFGLGLWNPGPWGWWIRMGIWPRRFRGHPLLGLQLRNYSFGVPWHVVHGTSSPDPVVTSATAKPDLLRSCMLLISFYLWS